MIAKTSRFLEAALLLFLLAGLASCQSGFYQKSLMVEDDRVALYSLPAEDYPDDDTLAELPPLADFPQLGEEKLVDLFGNLEFKRSTFWGVQSNRVFYEEEVRHLAHHLAQVLENAKQGERIVIISRFDPDHSVLSRAERVTALLWADEEGLNLVLGEIREEIPPDDTFENENAWKQILPISLKRNYPDLSLQKSPDYTLKKIRGYQHETWAVFDPARLESITFKPPHSDKAKETPAVRVSNVERLRRLKQAYDEGLISETEYQKKRAEIVDDL